MSRYWVRGRVRVKGRARVRVRVRFKVVIRNVVVVKCEKEQIYPLSMEIMDYKLNRAI